LAAKFDYLASASTSGWKRSAHSPRLRGGTIMRVTLGTLADSRQEQRDGERHRHAGPLGRGPKQIEAPAHYPLRLVPLVQIKMLAEHARPLFQRATRRN
jgi:hypothetical protein